MSLGALTTVVVTVRRAAGYVLIELPGGAILLELLQLVVPDRDARVLDVVTKLIGGGGGIIVARVLYPRRLASFEPDESVRGDRLRQDRLTR